MHAVLITFTSAIEPTELAGPFREYARALDDVPGLVSKTWLADEDVLGGFYLFETSEVADEYLGGSLLASVAENPVFSNFAIRRIDVLEQLSAMTNGLGGTSPLAPARHSHG
jgi:hypothetical protein